MNRKLTPYLLLVPQMILSMIFIIGLITGILQSFGVIPAFGLVRPTFRYYKEILTRPDMLKSITYSLYIALMSSALATVIGVWLCALMTVGKKKRSGMYRVVQLPIIVPHVMVALFAINILSQNGILARICYALGVIKDQQQFPLLLYDTNGMGIIIGYLWKEIPFIIFFVIALMSNIDGNLGEAAVNLGAGKWKSFLKVTLPLCSKTILSGFLIVFVFTLGAYEMPLLLGATSPKALPVLAYIQFTHPDLRNRPYAMALNGIIIVISLLCACMYFGLMNKNVKQLEKKRT